MTRMTDNEPHFSVETLPKAIEALRSRAVFDVEEEVSRLPPEAEQLWLLSLAALDQAARFAKLAVLARHSAPAPMGTQGRPDYRRGKETP